MYVIEHAFEEHVAVFTKVCEVRETAKTAYFGGNWK